MNISKFLQLLLALIVYSCYAAGQLTNEKQSLCIFLDEDYLNFKGAGTDRYYTYGLRIDYFFFKKKKPGFPSNCLLKISQERNVYGWGAAQLMFTPKNIRTTEIQYNDRPYAGALYGVHSLQSFDDTRKIKITSEILLGVIGPLSLAEETQILGHRLVNYIKPNGWRNQVPNDLIVNYNISMEKQVLLPSKKILVNAVIETFSGTLYNAAGIGFMMRLGKFNSYFENVNPQGKSKRDKFQLYMYSKPVARVVLSNALLQGGLMNQVNHQKKGFTLNNDQVERLVVLFDAGITCEVQKFSVTIRQKMSTAEFKGQSAQEVGNITLQFKL